MHCCLNSVFGSFLTWLFISFLQLAKTQGNVFATDAILATLMCCTRSVNSWDIIVQRVGNKLFFDKRDNSDFGERPAVTSSWFHSDVLHLVCSEKQVWLKLNKAWENSSWPRCFLQRRKLDLRWEFLNHFFIYPGFCLLECNIYFCTENGINVS